LLGGGWLSEALADDSLADSAGFGYAATQWSLARRRARPPTPSREELIADLVGFVEFFHAPARGVLLVTGAEAIQLVGCKPDAVERMRLDQLAPFASKPLVHRVGRIREVIFNYWHETGGYVLRYRFLVTDDFEVAASFKEVAEHVGPFHF
jgi:hypothetical protein